MTGGMWVCCAIREKGCHMIYCVVSVCTQCVYPAMGAHNSISSHVYNESVTIPNDGIVSMGLYPPEWSPAVSCCPPPPPLGVLNHKPTER